MIIKTGYKDQKIQFQSYFQINYYLIIAYIDQFKLMNVQQSESKQWLMPIHHALFAIAAMVGGLFSMMLLFIALFHGIAL